MHTAADMHPPVMAALHICAPLHLKLHPTHGSTGAGHAKPKGTAGCLPVMTVLTSLAPSRSALSKIMRSTTALVRSAPAAHQKKGS